MELHLSPAVGVVLTGIVALLWGSASAEAEAGAASRPAIAPRTLRLDLKKRRVTIIARVCLREGPLEFLICRTSGKGRDSKEHESILHTDAKPSHIHAALLALGLTQGKPARWSSVGRLAGRFLPPQGPQLDITFHWTDPKGKARSAQAGSWLKAVGAKGASLPGKWVFIGSAVLPDNQYAADIEGGIVSVANFASSVIDVPFESSDKDALREFAADSEAIPPLKTEVKVVISPLPGAAKSPHARAMLEIDRLGRMKVDGTPIAPGKLRRWAAAFVAAHPKAMVTIRTEARALVYDVERARDELGLGGIMEVDEQHLRPYSPILPRHPEQARRKLKWWARQFAEADQLLSDPVLEAQATLRQIDKELAEIQRVKVMWDDYAAQLREALAKYRASTQPADKGRTGPPARANPE